MAQALLFWPLPDRCPNTRALAPLSATGAPGVFQLPDGGRRRAILCADRKGALVLH